MNTCLVKPSSLVILVTGGQGQLAQALAQYAASSPFQIHFFSRAQLNITDMTSIENVFAHIAPDIVINTAAYTAVDQAEKDYQQAMEVNFQGVKNLALYCQQYGITLIHVSTDYIFDGNKNAPYHEKDAANPINHYGESKWSGDQVLQTLCEKHFILRVSGVFSEYRHNFLKSMLRLGTEKKELHIVDDQVTCPTYAGDIAHVLLKLAENVTHFGTYHYCNATPLSWYQFACAIFKEAKKYRRFLVEEILPISSHEYKTPAKRPAYSVLDCSKIKKDYGVIQIPLEKTLEKLCHYLTTF